MWKTAILITILGHAFAERIAVVHLREPDGLNNVTGTINFTKTADGVVITGEVNELSAGNHGFHIHNLGYINSGCLGTGGHFNPHNVTHGGPNSTTRHVGDLGNIIADSSGIATISFTDTVIDLEGEHNIIGRAVVVHVGEDDLGTGDGDSLTTGNAGARLACGVIGILEDGPNSSTVVTASYILTMAVSISMYGLKALF